MSSFKELKHGEVALIRQNEDGTIKQIGLTQEQSDMLQAFIAAISKESPLVVMPKEFDLTLKTLS